MNTCTIDGCTRSVLARGMCGPHYGTWHRRQTWHEITCAFCGTPAYVGRPNQKYCSTTCAAKVSQPAATAARREQRRPISRRVPALYARPIRTHQPLEVRTTRRLTSGRCRACNQWFVSINTDITCSQTCWDAHHTRMRHIYKARRRAIKRAAYVEDVWRNKVFEQDGYRCHLCGKRTDRGHTSQPTAGRHASSATARKATAAAGSS